MFEQVGRVLEVDTSAEASEIHMESTFVQNARFRQNKSNDLDKLSNLKPFYLTIPTDCQTLTKSFVKRLGVVFVFRELISPFL